MKLYQWRSEALKNYTSGYILAIGTDLEDARSNARKHLEKIARQNWEWLFEKYPDFELIEDEKEERDAKLAMLEADIMKDPEVSDAFFIQGGE